MSIERTNSISSAWRAAVLLALTFFPLSFLHVILHEGGHALVAWIYGIANVQIFVHPFAFSGYSRPIFDCSNILFHLAGFISAVIIPLIIFLFRKRFHTPATFFLVMLLPWSIFWEGLNMASALLGTGDFYNVSQLIGVSVLPFALIGFIMIMVGIVLIDSYLPLTGLLPANLHSLWALPVSFILWVLPSVAVARLWIPASDFALRYQLVGEITDVATMWLFIMFIVALLLAAVYITLFRFIARKVPRFDQRAKVITRQDLAWPILWCLISIVLGLIWIL